MTLSIVFNLITRAVLDTPDVPDSDIQAVNPENADEIRIPGLASVEDDYIGFGDVVLPRESAAFSADKADILNDDLDAVTITLPDPCFLSINGAVEAVTGGVYSFTSPNAGWYSLGLVGRYKAETIMITVHDLIAAKSTIKKQINQQYETIWQGGFSYGGHNFESDKDSMNLIVAAAAEAARTPPEPLDGWMSSANVWVILDRAGFEGLAAALHAHTKALFAVKTIKKSALSLLADLDPIVNFDVTGGWT
ncbi:MAG: hypothetical protein JKY45_02565 [Emcibacter sp.]|nr:hypothetical protein [Emcibacter sp.]